METQGAQPLGGLMANAAMQATGNAGYAVAVADAAGPLDALWAPGGARTASAASVRRGRGVPYGFENLESFSRFGNAVRVGLGRAGYGDVEPILQGSAITGKSFRTGRPFDVGRVSDFDVGLASQSLLKRAETLGVGLRSGGTRTGPLTARDLQLLGLRDLANQLSQQAGRDVNFMIYNSPATAIQRAPSVTLPNLRE
ncbi:hypothetical protein [Burkholderia sp. IMCC1007]|uniref:hypothetical protein n=1 Tax=Burkholderia sp. IMCC1007 TaxID=3004104 RepID=UPI0022B4C2D6|nr:hypothetical protein [Burkholderia sp. IMCC1007]